MDAIAELEARRGQYPPERYPVQHATVCFHLGALLTDADRADEGAVALRRAVELFGAAGLSVERTKALNALGAALRSSGHLDEARAAFSEAAGAFAEAGLRADEGAALHNLGLVSRDPDAFRRAQTSFAEAGERRAAAAAARELGIALLERSELDEAERTLREAADLAAGAGDTAGLGAASNGLGLALLAAGRAAEAVAPFREAAAAHPRGIRPGEHAMAKANLALAYTRAGDERRARLAARQARATPDAAAPVLAQADALLAKLPPARDDLAVVLGEENDERRVAVAREELTRWAEAPGEERLREASAWVETAPPELAVPLLGALLELPPAAMERIVASFVACADNRFRRAVERAQAQFPPPQLLRLEQAFAWN